jgi:hypothetical protein
MVPSVRVGAKTVSCGGTRPGRPTARRAETTRWCHGLSVVLSFYEQQ